MNEIISLASLLILTVSLQHIVLIVAVYTMLNTFETLMWLTRRILDTVSKFFSYRCPRMEVGKKYEKDLKPEGYCPLSRL